MIGKIVTGKSFGGAVRYLLGKEPGKAYILTSDGVELSSRQALIGSFEFQRRARPDVERVVGHISLSFHPDDDPRMSNQLMLDLAREYMQRMGITGTQYLVVRHTDTKHPHLHILYNRVRYDTTLVPDRNERLRNMRICRELKQEYGLTFSHGKEQVATERLHGPEQLRHRIYDHLREVLPECATWTALAEELAKRQVATTFVHRGGDPTKEIQGVTFTLEGHTFKASQVDRKFSYGRLTQRIEQNRLRQAMIERVRNYTDEQRPQVTSILQKLEAEKQQQLEPPHRNLSIAGKPLTEEQIEMLREGEPIFVRGTQSEGYGDGRPAADGVGLSGRSAGLGGVREIHNAAHGPGPDRGGLCGAGTGEMVGRHDGTALPLEREGIGYDLPGELGRSPRTTPCPNSKAAGPATPFHHPEEEVAWPESVTGGAPVVTLCRKPVPFHPSAKIRLAGIGCKAVRSAPWDGLASAPAKSGAGRYREEGDGLGKLDNLTKTPPCAGGCRPNGRFLVG